MSYYDYSTKPRPTARVERMRSLPNDGSRTLFFKLHGFGKSGRFLRPHEVSDFDGEEAIFEYERKAGLITLLRLVEVTRR